MKGCLIWRGNTPAARPTPPASQLPSLSCGLASNGFECKKHAPEYALEPATVFTQAASRHLRYVLIPRKRQHNSTRQKRVDATYNIHTKRSLPWSQSKGIRRHRRRPPHPCSTRQAAPRRLRGSWRRPEWAGNLHGTAVIQSTKRVRSGRTNKPAPSPTMPQNIFGFCE